MQSENPFTPSFGEVPEHLAGRRDVVRGFKKAFESPRRRLIDAGVIGERSRGVVGFDLPLFREYLIEQRG